MNEVYFKKIASRVETEAFKAECFDDRCYVVDEIKKGKIARKHNANKGEKVYSIIDETGSKPCFIGKMRAGNGKQALVKFMRAKGMSAYLYTLDKAKRGAWQLTNALGTTIVAVES